MDDKICCSHPVHDEHVTKAEVVDEEEEEEWWGVFCFLGRDNNSARQAFTGRLIDTSPKKLRQLGVMGTQLLDYVGETHKCCCDAQDPPLYFQMTLVDFQTNSEFTQVVQVTGGDYVQMKSEHLRFATQQLESGSKADVTIAKYFPTRFCGKDAIVCIGQAFLKTSIEFDSHHHP
eukprot:TRINITY_DN1640_c0_g1_i1.p1 TRINITY_DN1640_c0_g1~~TRINITY_DN1640_c0_g1_i1.p1  ORF type:complete len:175 (+),score=43.90 TRINITY_DN1640_c0_g1_i1:53-577(+)